MCLLRWFLLFNGTEDLNIISRLANFRLKSILNTNANHQVTSHHKPPQKTGAPTRHRRKRQQPHFQIRANTSTSSSSSSSSKQQPLEYRGHGGSVEVDPSAQAVRFYKTTTDEDARGGNDLRRSMSTPAAASSSCSSAGRAGSHGCPEFSPYLPHRATTFTSFRSSETAAVN